MSTSASSWPTSHLQAADTAFAALTAEPDPLSLDCDAVTAVSTVDLDLPRGRVPLPALRRWLLSRPDNFAARDAVWRDLVVRARTAGPHWVIAAVGMAMPALIRIAGQLTTGHHGDPRDIDSEVLTGFLQALREQVDPQRPAVYAELCFAGFRAGQRARAEHHRLVPVECLHHAVPASRLPDLPYGHPDLLVERAATLGIINDEDVQPWIDIRLAGRSIHPIAERLGLDSDTLRMRLTRADTRIADALRTGLLSAGVSPHTAGELRAQAADRARRRATPTATGPRVPVPADATGGLAVAA